MRRKHGKAYRVRAFFRDAIVLSGPDAFERIWLDRDHDFSAARGYTDLFGHLASTSLLMMDFDLHRRHRQALNPAFKAAVMQGYLVQMHQLISQRLEIWGRGGSFQFYPAAKQLTLDVATEVFLGSQPAGDRKKVNEALTNILASALAVVRLAIPGTKYQKGIKAQQFIEQTLKSEIPARRSSESLDIFTRLCNSKDDAGTSFSDDEIVGHLITFWLAGHDTLASALSTLVGLLGSHLEWQQKLAVEISSLNLEGKQPTREDLNKLVLCGYAFQEALRFFPPAINTPRVALRDTEFNGYCIPKNVQISVSLYDLHRNAEYWPDPDQFDPMRFAPENTSGNRHRFSFAPFGGGAHKCIGMFFAQTQAKVFLVNLLSRYEIRLAENYEMKMQMLPTPRPKNGLPVRLIAKT